MAKNNGIHGMSTIAMGPSGQESAYLIEVAHRQPGFDRILMMDGLAQRRIMDVDPKAEIQQGGSPHHDTRANYVQYGLEGISAHQKHRERNKRRNATA